MISKKIEACFFIGCLCISFVLAENKTSYVTLEEEKVIDDYFYAVLNAKVEERETNNNLEENTIVLVDNVYQKPLQFQEEKVENKSAEKYVEYLREFVKEIELLNIEKEKTLKQLESQSKKKLELRIKEVETETIQGFTEKDSDFYLRVKNNKEDVIQAEQKRLEQEIQRVSIHFGKMIENITIEKERLETELLKIEFRESAELIIGDFVREVSDSTLQYFPMEITNLKLGVNKYKARLEVPKGAEDYALYINNKKENFTAQVIYTIDLKNNYDFILVAIEIFDKTSDKLIKRIENFSYKEDFVEFTHKESSKKNTEKKRERYINSICNELIISGKNNFSSDFRELCIDVQYLPFCLYTGNYVLKFGCGMSFNENFNITAIVKNGLSFKKMAFDFGVGIVFSKFDFDVRNASLFASAEIDWHITEFCGLNIAYIPAEICLKNSNIQNNFIHSVNIGITFTGLYY